MSKGEGGGVMEQQKRLWRVYTDRGNGNTHAVSEAKAIANVCYKLVMDRRAYKVPRAEDLEEIASIKVYGAECDVYYPPGDGKIEGERHG